MAHSLGTYFLLCLSALAAGVVNAVAGGGTLLTFPVLLTVIPSVAANATSTVALVPGSMAGAWGYRRELAVTRRWALVLLAPCLLGGMVGTLLVTQMEERYFDLMVPWLILVATLLFLAQPALARLTGVGMPHAAPSGGALAAIIGIQFVVAVYGGYFGAGIGILMLASMTLLGLNDIHQMNGLKAFLAACINAVAVAIFVWQGKVVWHFALLMALAAIAGGYVGARVARRLKQGIVRWAIIAIGLGLSAYFFFGPRPSPTPAPAASAKAAGSACL
jgi:uncharacterized membrane protein YfcA